MTLTIQPKDQLALDAAHVQRAAPNSWAAMVTALDVLVEDAQKLCIQAPPDKVFIMQGRAQALIELRDVLTNPVKRANELDTKQKELRSHGR